MKQAENSAIERGAVIREMRQQVGITAKDLADEARIDRDTLAAIETGRVRGKPYRRGPNPSTLAAVEHALSRLIRIRGERHP